MPDGSITAPSEAREVHHLLVANVRPSPTQHRRAGRDGADLVASILEHGVLHPVWVRTLRAGPTQDECLYELVFGERRRNASEAAGRERIRAEIHDELSDEDVAVLQALENIGRKDVTPLEEAESYRILRDEFGLGEAAIAARVHREERQVRRILQLLALVPEARDALDRQLLTVDAALALATLSDDAGQREATAELLRGAAHLDGEPVGRRSAYALVRNRYQLRLADAQWDRGDAALVPAAGACTSCPKRSGAQVALWAEMDDEEDRCTDRVCWTKKSDAHWERIKAAAAARGARVLEGEEAKKLYPHGSWLTPPRGARVIDLDAPCAPIARAAADEADGRAADLARAGKHEEADRVRDEAERWRPPTWREVLGDKLSAVAVARDPHGRTHEIVEEERAVAVLREEGRLPAPPPAQRPDGPVVREPGGAAPAASPPAAAPAEHRLREQIATLAVQKALGAVAEAAAERKPDLRFWRFLAALLTRALDGYDVERVVERRELVPPKDGGGADPNVDALLAEIETAREPELRGLVVEFVAVMGVSLQDEDSALARAARFFDVDLGKIQKAAEKKVRGKAAPAPPAPAASEDAPASGQPAPAAFAHPCAECGAVAGKPCKTKTGRRAAKVHPARVELLPRCRVCGCSDAAPCEGGCVWTEADLCSVCAEIQEFVVGQLERLLGASERDLLSLVAESYEDERERAIAGMQDLLVRGRLRVRSEDNLLELVPPEAEVAASPKAKRGKAKLKGPITITAYREHVLAALGAGPVQRSMVLGEVEKIVGPLSSGPAQVLEQAVRSLLDDGAVGEADGMLSIAEQDAGGKKGRGRGRK